MFHLFRRKERIFPPTPSPNRNDFQINESAKSNDVTNNSESQIFLFIRNANRSDFHSATKYIQKQLKSYKNCWIIIAFMKVNEIREKENVDKSFTITFVWLRNR